MNVTSHVGALVALSALWFLVVPQGDVRAAPPSADRKCSSSGLRAGEPVIPLLAIDGEIKGPVSEPDPAGGELSVLPGGIDRKQVHSILLVCMSPRDSTFGPTTGINVISVWTLDGPIAQVESVFAGIKAAQHEHYQARSRYLADLDGVDVTELPANVTLSYEARETGWAVLASFDGRTMRCSIFEGTPAWTGNAGEPLCGIRGSVGIKRAANSVGPIH